MKTFENHYLPKRQSVLSLRSLPDLSFDHNERDLRLDHRPDIAFTAHLTLPVDLEVLRFEDARLPKHLEDLGIAAVVSTNGRLPLALLQCVKISGLRLSSTVNNLGRSYGQTSVADVQLLEG